MRGCFYRRPGAAGSLTVAAGATRPTLSRLALAGLAALLLAILLSPVGFGVRAATTPPHVMIVLMENTSYEQIVGNSQMPYVNGLVATNGSVSTTDLSHPSEPNYLGLVSGSIQDNPQDLTPQDRTYAGPQFTDELATAGIGWKAYMEDMPVACDLTDQYSPGNYDVNHNPFMYFISVRNSASQCNRDVPYPQLTTDLNAGTAPPFLWVSPNTINDMHDGTPAQGDNFLKGLVTQVQASTWWTPGSRIIITWDEGATTEQVLTLVVGSAHGTQANGGNEYGTLRGLEEAYGVGLLGGSANPSNGDILPMLTGAAPPSPSPTPTPTSAPSPSPTPSALPSTSPTPSSTPSASPTPSPSTSPQAGSTTRGIFRFTSTDFATMHSAGFNASTDGGVQDNGAAQAAVGMTGMVWVDAYSNTACTQTMTDSAIAALVQANVNAGHPGLRYEIGDEPTANGCNAPATYAHITQVVHGVDALAKTWVIDDQLQAGNPIQAGIPMKGTVDILAFDVYPCTSGPCDFAAIDSAVQQIHAAQITNWEFVIQDFSSSPWRWPTAAEIQAQFDHWKGQGASGYWVFAWDYVGLPMTSQAGNLAALQAINSQAINPGSPSPSPSSSPTPSPSPSGSSSLSATAGASSTLGSAPFAVSFSSTPSGGVAPYTYTWAFDDGALSTGQSPSHTYTVAGSYAPSVTVTDATGAQAVASAGTITVTGPVTGNPGTLVATAGVSMPAGDAPFVATLTGSATGGTPPYIYSWDPGELTIATLDTPTQNHLYSAPGVFAAILTVSDSGGQISQSTTLVTVYPPLVVSASAKRSSGRTPLRVVFQASAQGGLGPYTFSWNFGDRRTGSGATIAHTYSLGRFRPTLTVRYAAGGVWSGPVATVAVTRLATRQVTLRVSQVPLTPTAKPPAQPAPPALHVASAPVLQIAADAASNIKVARADDRTNDPLVLLLTASGLLTVLAGLLFLAWRRSRTG
jgi:PKD repeat protein